ncbi:hypothetical protein Cgig2_009684 [Carnegiea gigantea]|uniref:Uncharacterized protein n=1 Tax=Carnegiea gigantea TaxID=171969 RepID=A0A9Q1K5R8_9CARY|nr:hypothetical protein Cgig2_009684 [Carnegiea gigantea]
MIWRPKDGKGILLCEFEILKKEGRTTPCKGDLLTKQDGEEGGHRSDVNTFNLRKRAQKALPEAHIRSCICTVRAGLPGSDYSKQSKGEMRSQDYTSPSSASSTASQLAWVASAPPSGGSSRAYSGEDGWAVDTAPEWEWAISRRASFFLWA